jgi:5-methylthioadenosine/S-adenosylhomocysteine deaminase
MATRDAARALGKERETGSLEPGKFADLIALDLDDIGWAPFAGQDYYTQLVYSVSGYSVTDTMVEGRWLMRDKKLLTVDYKNAVERMERDNVELQRRLGSS